MKKGDIIVCVNNKRLDTNRSSLVKIIPLTIGKQYTVSRIVNTDVEILNDNGIISYFYEKRFITLREYNLNKLI